MTLAEIAAASGLPARTLRFYIARGLMPGPVKGGRNAEYTADHLAAIEQIRRHQARGRTLAEIAGILHAPTSKGGPPAAATRWQQYAVAGDVMVWVQEGSSPWRAKQIRAALEEFSRRVGMQEQETEKESNTP